MVQATRKLQKEGDDFKSNFFMRNREKQEMEKVYKLGTRLGHIVLTRWNKNHKKVFNYSNDSLKRISLKTGLYFPAFLLLMSGPGGGSRTASRAPPFSGRALLKTSHKSPRVLTRVPLGIHRYIASDKVSKK